MNTDDKTKLFLGGLAVLGLVVFVRRPGPVVGGRSGPSLVDRYKDSRHKKRVGKVLERVRKNRR